MIKLVNKVVQLDLLNGYRINAIEGDCIAKEIMADGIHEPLLYSFLCSYLSSLDDPICIDVGANIGAHTLTMAKYSKQVIAFEPITEVYDLIVKSISDNNIYNCTVKNIALGEKSEIVKLNLRPESGDNIGSSSIWHQGSDSSASININLEPGDTVEEIKQVGKVDFIKIDVEGHEPNVILGLQETIKKHLPVIGVEWNCDETRKGFADNDIFNTILNDYVAFELADNERLFRYWTRKYKIMVPFKPILRFFYKTFTSKAELNKPVLIRGFDKSNNYMAIMFIPKNKVKSVVDVLKKENKTEGWP